eukprot:CAMPEP_0173094250 /NCGR_PEP_ID=MMETSP1102-20130122/30769_1 /TAXON_ID=49646 /ORGANISM="Geminigera sp., Strain Caron Lab Isolate" /LENGTH=76 /DNA_ID=CAMNT_0013983011 /DNA_START=111 /DNA_END=338 /DNA_ORIENTATION=+
MDPNPEKRLLPVEKADETSPPPTTLAVDAALDVYVIIPSLREASESPFSAESCPPPRASPSASERAAASKSSSNTI